MITVTSIITLMILFFGLTPYTLALTFQYHTKQNPSTATLFNLYPIEINGKAFLNGSTSGHESRTLIFKQQLTGIKWMTQIKIDPTHYIHAFMIYNPTPTSLNSNFYFDDLYYHAQQADSPFYMDIGKQWIPFGRYKNNLIYKPMTKTLGQTNKKSMVLGLDDLYHTNITLYEKQIKTHSSTAFALNIEKKWRNKNNVGVSYINSLEESQLFLSHHNLTRFYPEKVVKSTPGFAAYAHVNYRNIYTYLTFVTALHPFDNRLFSYQGKGAQPAAMSIQSAYDWDTFILPIELILFYDKTQQSLALNLPNQRIGVGLNAYPNQFIDIQFEYFCDEGYKQNKHASFLDKISYGNASHTKTAAVQLVVHFL